MSPDPNPLRRLMALPNESRAKTLIVAFLVSVVCAGLVSGATVLLRPIQAANRAAEEQARIAALIRGVPGMAELLETEGSVLSTVVVNLTTGQAARDVTPETLAAALADPASYSAIDPAQDIAGLGQRPDVAQVYLLRQGEEISLLLLPIAGSGYNGRIEALLALRGDLNTVAGVAVTRHAETPGLGARITEPAWQASWPGTLLRDEGGTLRFAVARGPASTVHEVDGITGATRTSNAVTRMVRFWMGPAGYGPFLNAVGKGEF